MKIRKLISLCLTVLTVLSLFAACGGNSGGETQSADAVYKVIVQDALGKPQGEGLAVKFLKDGQQVAMQIPNDSGVAEKTLARDNYTVELQFTNQEVEYHYDTSDLILTADKTELTVVLSKILGQEVMTLYAGGKDNDAWFVTPGCTNVTLNPEDRTYFIFNPLQAGTYEFSLVGSDAAIGYYGESFFVQDNAAIEVKDNKFQMSVSEDMLGGTPVIGIDAGQGDAILCIDRIGDAAWSIEQEPWTVYQPTVEITPYTLPAGAALHKFDITAATETYELVFNENDGYYHLGTADGALVVVLIAKGQETPDYTDTFEGIMENYGPRRIFFDEEGNFVKKEGYVECLQKYIDNSDETYGVYPMTEDLKYIMQQFGIQQGWFVPSDPGYLFRDNDGMNVPGINNDISWLFMCRYL